jgi:hypothetical protein
MAIQKIEVGQELLNVPMGEMIRSMAMAIADAQWELDKSGMVVAELMSGQRLLRDLDTGELIDFSGDVIEPLRDSAGQVQRDNRGEPVYSPENGPRSVDSRVYFGYTYEAERDASGEIVTEIKDGESVPRMIRVPSRLSMMELGFTPTFYQFVETVIEVKIAIKMASTTEAGYEVNRDYSYRRNVLDIRWGHGHSSTTSAYASSVNGAYSNKYGYSVEGSSLLRTRMAPVPPPAMLQERIRKVMEAEQEYLDIQAGRKALPAAAESTPATDNI